MGKDSLAQIAPADTAIGPPSAPARRLVDASVSDNTRRAYAGALRRLDTWLAGRPLDDAALAAYLSRHALREAAGQAAGRLFALALLQEQPDAMQVGGQYLQCDGAHEAVGAMASDTVEPPMLQPIDGRLDRRMRTPRGR